MKPNKGALAGSAVDRNEALKGLYSAGRDRRKIPEANLDPLNF
jgi:hypothetical protein